MSMLQTIVRFLSLKSRPEDFPKAKVSGDIIRTLAVMNGLSNGGLRTIQVDRSGHLRIIPPRMQDLVLATELAASSGAFFTVSGAPWSGFTFMGKVKAPINYDFDTDLGAVATSQQIIPSTMTGLGEGADRYLFFNGTFYGDWKRVRWNGGGSDLYILVKGFRFPER